MPASSSSDRVRCARATALAVGLLVAGCGPQYEINRPGTWQPTGVNDYNLRAMAADPRDLTAGQGTATNRGNGSARAVTRLYTDRRRSLLNASLSRIAPSGDSQDASLGAAAGAGASAQ